MYYQWGVQSNEMFMLIIFWLFIYANHKKWWNIIYVTRTTQLTYIRYIAIFNYCILLLY